jgi:malate synthase
MEAAGARADLGSSASGVNVRATVSAAHGTILTPEALGFLGLLHRRFDQRRRELLAARAQRQARFDAGERPNFLRETESVREGDWSVAPTPVDLRDRRVEITGPVDRKMIINALNSGASVFMADFEDATTPTWSNQLDGQVNLHDAVLRSIDFDDPQTGRHYSLADKTATLIVRPRGWHLEERHVLVDGQPMSGSLFDFGLYFFHNAARLLANGSGPYFYLPKLESHLEARLWNDVFVFAQATVGIPHGSIRATVLIETILAAFEMDEILYELRDHAAGLNCGRWDYIFSFIKKFRGDPAFVLPDRGQVTMTCPFMRAYSLLAIKTCHRRKAHAIGGMAAQIPIRNDDDANRAALEKVRADKEREAGDGHDGTWVAHPGLVPLAREVFDRLMPEANQVHRQRQDVDVKASDLLAVPSGTITEGGLRLNVNVGIRYIEAWLRGLGCVPLNNLMEDAATAEISRSQVWQWLRHGAMLDDGRRIDRALFDRIVAEELSDIRKMVGDAVYDEGRYADAGEIFVAMSTSESFIDFLTLPAYDRILAEEGA